MNRSRDLSRALEPLVFETMRESEPFRAVQDAWGDSRTFEAVEAIASALCSRVQKLPLSDGLVFHRAEGYLHYACRAAVSALVLMRREILFFNLPLQDREQEVLRIKYAVVICAFYAPLARLIRSTRVTNESGEIFRFQMPLARWLARQSGRVLMLERSFENALDAQNAALQAMTRDVPEALWEFLQESGNRELTSSIFAIVANRFAQLNESGALFRVTLQAEMIVNQRELARAVRRSADAGTRVSCPTMFGLALSELFKNEWSEHNKGIEHAQYALIFHGDLYITVDLGIEMLTAKLLTLFPLMRFEQLDIMKSAADSGVLSLDVSGTFFSVPTSWDDKKCSGTFVPALKLVNPAAYFASTSNWYKKLQSSLTKYKREDIRVIKPSVVSAETIREENACLAYLQLPPETLLDKHRPQDGMTAGMFQRLTEAAIRRYETEKQNVMNKFKSRFSELEYEWLLLNARERKAKAETRQSAYQAEIEKPAKEQTVQNAFPENDSDAEPEREDERADERAEAREPAVKTASEPACKSEGATADKSAGVSSLAAATVESIEQVRPARAKNTASRQHLKQQANPPVTAKTPAREALVSKTPLLEKPPLETSSVESSSAETILSKKVGPTPANKSQTTEASKPSSRATLSEPTRSTELNPPMENMTNETSAKNLTKGTPKENMTNEMPTENMTNETTAKSTATTAIDTPNNSMKDTRKGASDTRGDATHDTQAPPCAAAVKPEAAVPGVLKRMAQALRYVLRPHATLSQAFALHEAGAAFIVRETNDSASRAEALVSAAVLTLQAFVNHPNRAQLLGVEECRSQESIREADKNVKKTTNTGDRFLGSNDVFAAQILKTLSALGGGRSTEASEALKEDKSCAKTIGSISHLAIALTRVESSPVVPATETIARLPENTPSSLLSNSTDSKNSADSVSSEEFSDSVAARETQTNHEKKTTPEWNDVKKTAKATKSTAGSKQSAAAAKTPAAKKASSVSKPKTAAQKASPAKRAASRPSAAKAAATKASTAKTGVCKRAPSGTTREKAAAGKAVSASANSVKKTATQAPSPKRAAKTADAAGALPPEKTSAAA